MQKHQPSYKDYCFNHKLEIDKATLDKFGNNVKDLLDYMSKN